MPFIPTVSAVPPPSPFCLSQSSNADEGLQYKAVVTINEMTFGNFHKGV